MSKINYYLFLVLISLALFLPGLVALPVIDRDEAHFAQASRQMMQTHQFFQIRFQETTRFQKPPGINWMQAFFVRVFSNEQVSPIWPYRLPSLLGALLAVCFTFFFASRFVKAEVAFWAAVFLACSLLLNVEAHMAVTDAALLCSVVLMQGALWVIYQAGKENRKAAFSWALLFWSALTLGFVLKGVTPFIALLTVIALGIMDRGWKAFSGLRLGLGLSLFVILTLLWSLQVDKAEHSNYLLQMFQRDLLPKLKGGHESHGAPPLTHLILLPITFWPISLFFWQGGAYAIRNYRQSVVRFLLAWILPVWFFFEIMPTKLPQYVLPTFPAIAILLSLGVDEALYAIKNSRVMLWLQGTWVVLTIGISFIFLIVSYILMHRLLASACVAFIIVVILSLSSFYCVKKNNYSKARWILLGMAILTFPLLFEWVLPVLSPLWLSSRIAMVARAHGVTPEHPLIAVGYNEPSLVFYLNTKEIVFGDLGQIKRCLKEQKKCLFLMETSDFLKTEKMLGIYSIAEVDGYNYSIGHWQKLVLVEYRRKN